MVPLGSSVSTRFAFDLAATPRGHRRERSAHGRARRVSMQSARGFHLLSMPLANA